jgi:hypothetical protein
MPKVQCEGILERVKLSSYRCREGWVIRVDLPEGMSCQTEHVRVTSTRSSVIIGMADHGGVGELLGE